MNKNLNKSHFNCWQYKMSQLSIDDILFGSEGSIGDGTCFVYLSFFNQTKNFFKSGWRSFKSKESMLGFIEYVMIPTTLYNWYDLESLGFYMPISSFDILVKELKKTKHEDFGALIDLKNRYLNQLVSEEKLTGFIKRYNKMYHEPNRRMYFKCFNSLMDIYDYLDENIEFDESFEEELMMTKLKFKAISSDISSYPFFQNKMMEHLNTNINTVI